MSTNTNTDGCLYTMNGHCRACSEWVERWQEHLDAGFAE